MVAFAAGSCSRATCHGSGLACSPKTRHTVRGTGHTSARCDIAGGAPVLHAPHEQQHRLAPPPCRSCIIRTFANARRHTNRSLCWHNSSNTAASLGGYPGWAGMEDNGRHGNRTRPALRPPGLFRRWRIGLQREAQSFRSLLSSVGKRSFRLRSGDSYCTSWRRRVKASSSAWSWPFGPVFSFRGTGQQIRQPDYMSHTRSACKRASSPSLQTSTATSTCQAFRQLSPFYSLRTTRPLSLSLERYQCQCHVRPRGLRFRLARPS